MVVTKDHRNDRPVLKGRNNVWFRFSRCACVPHKYDRTGARRECNEMLKVGRNLRSGQF